jgi:hypothetical protein
MMINDLLHDVLLRDDLLSFDSYILLFALSFIDVLNATYDV